MVTAQNILEALEESLEQIHKKLALEDWSKFYHDLVPLREGFSNVTDRNALEVAADPVWKVCLRYPFVKDLVLQHSAQRGRKLEAGGTGREDVLSVSETVNRFQSLLVRLEEMEHSEESENRQGENTVNNGGGH